jgi:class 3 adenylate cyclase/HAMP domain-containing protein
MHGLSFRYKLLLAMMLVVGGVSLSTYLITQRRVQATYNSLFEQMVQREISYQPRAQEARLSNVRRQCIRMARSVRLLASLAEEDIDVDALYDTAGFELRDILQGDEEPEPEPEAEPSRDAMVRNGGFKTVQVARFVRERLQARRRAARQSVAELFRFIDSEGKLLVPSAETAERLGIKWLDQPELEKQLNRIGRKLPNLDEQHVGYVHFEPAGAVLPRVLEIVVTPIIDEFEGGIAGAMIVGLPFMNFGEETINDVGDIENGLWLNGKIYTRTIAPEWHDALGGLLRGSVVDGQGAPPNLELVKHGIPHRVFHTPLNPESQLPHAYKVGLYSLGSALEAEEELRSQMLMFSALAIMGALVFSLLLSHGLSVPLHQLVRGTEAIKAGDFSVKVPVSSHDELGQLAGSFNEMAVDLALKEKYHNVLNMVTDKDVAAELMKGHVALGGEKRKVSVLFCDIRGFTALTEGMDPAEVIAMLNEHMTALADVVADRSGVVDKFVGDEIMAVFGAPQTYGDDAFNCVSAGLEMIAERNRLNGTSKYQIEIGIGIATGEAVAGNMGSANRLNYTVLGARVNLGARFCGVAAPGEVVIDAATETELQDRIVTEQKDLLKLKGFTDEMNAFRVVAIKG